MEYPYRRPGGHEERLNRQVAGHLYYSLDSGPELLNNVFEDIPVSFSADTTLAATQDTPLRPQMDTETNRKLDWVLTDRDKLVGFESKYDSQLSKSQLRDELTKLRAHASDEDVSLIVITNDATRPSELAEIEADAFYWITWKSIAARVAGIDDEEIPAEQRVPLRMLQDLFEGEGLLPRTDEQPEQREENFDSIKQKLRDVEAGTTITIISDTGERIICQSGTVDHTNPIKFTSRGTTYTIRLHEGEREASLYSTSVDRRILAIDRT